MTEEAATGEMMAVVDDSSQDSSPPSPTPSMTPQLNAAPLTPEPTSDHSSSPPSELRAPQRLRLSLNQLESLSPTEFAQNWKELESYVDWVDMQAANLEAEVGSLRSYLERVKQQQIEASSRERAVLRRLASKEQEIQEYVAQISELKGTTTPNTTSLRSALLDPAVNLLIQKLRNELTQTRTQLEETQNELSAWKFTPDSNTGKRLMAKCRLLYQENEELGRAVSSGRIAKLEGELALQKSFSQEVKKSQSELDEFLQELDEDVEGMQSTIYYLQQELRKSRDAVCNLEHELRKFRKASRLAKKSKRRTCNEDGEVDEEVEEDDKAEAAAVVETDGDADTEVDGDADVDADVDAEVDGEAEVEADTETVGEEYEGDEEDKEWTEDGGEFDRGSEQIAGRTNGDVSTVAHRVLRSKRSNISDDSEESSEVPSHRKLRKVEDINGETRITNGNCEDNNVH